MDKRLEKTLKEEVKLKEQMKALQDKLVEIEEKRTDFYYWHSGVCHSPLGRHVSHPPRELRKYSNYRKRRGIRHLFPWERSGDQNKRHQCMRNKKRRGQNDRSRLPGPPLYETESS